MLVVDCARKHAAEAGGAVRDQACAALLGTFVGDALGMPLEGCSREFGPCRGGYGASASGPGNVHRRHAGADRAGRVADRAGSVEGEHLSRGFHVAHEPDRGYGGGTGRCLSCGRPGFRWARRPGECSAARARAGTARRCGSPRSPFAIAVIRSCCWERRLPAHRSRKRIRSGSTELSSRRRRSGRRSAMSRA